MAANGLAIAATVTGFVLFWGGVKNQTPSQTLKYLLSANLSGLNTSGTAFSDTSPPTIGVTDNASTDSDSGDTGTTGDTAGSNSAAANQGLAKLSVVTSHPTWATGTEWTDWVNIWNQESGWNNYATNPGSGAFGIAQALGHGNSSTAGTKVIEGSTHNEYGGYGLSDAAAKNANDGDALPQIQWGIDYISETYGSPSMAWAHEEQNGWY